MKNSEHQGILDATMGNAALRQSNRDAGKTDIAVTIIRQA
jgi:hypothetical protein